MTVATRGRLGAVFALVGVMGLAACAQQKPVVTPMPKPEPVVEAPKVAPVPKGRMTVALLLPLSGPAAGVGARLREAAEVMLLPAGDPALAARAPAASTGAFKAKVMVGPKAEAASKSDAEPEPEPDAKATAEGSGEETVVAPLDTSGLRLIIKDTQGKPEAAMAAAREALAAGANLVVGPLFGANAQAVRPILAEAGVPALALTNTRAAAGDTVFVLGHAPQPQVERILLQAKDNGQTRVLVVGPDTAYARLSLETARALAPKGITVVAADLYPAKLDYNSLVNRVKGLAAQSADVVLIPASGLDLVGLSSLFQYFTRVGEKQLLGTILWEDTRALEREISLRGGRYLSTRVLRPKIEAEDLIGSPVTGEAPEGAEEGQGKPVTEADLETVKAAEALADSLMAPDPIPAQPDFEAEAAKEVKPLPQPRDPDNLEALVMDAIALAAVWAEDRTGTLEAHLTASHGYQGASGLFRLDEDGTVERGYSVLELTRQGAVLVGAPLERFPGATAAPEQLPTRQIPPGPEAVAEEDGEGDAQAAPSAPTTRFMPAAPPRPTAPAVTPASEPKAAPPQPVAVEPEPS